MDKFPLDLDLVAKQVDLFSTSEKLIILYDVAYSYLYGKIFAWVKVHKTQNSFI
jgi:hypothetical protein